ncbi:2-dehydro-3-deoxygalactonokinase [Pseudoalteromonas fuliginea]|uniref:2-dehydro-3-deoxygalactonokinase n=1 Tax=Pseudoalteromonas fuliginea TaxID=1872678 RepID=UPI0031818B98
MSNNKSNLPALIIVDWGSSNFRAFLVDNKGMILDTVNGEQGVLSIKNGCLETVLLSYISDWLLEYKMPIIMAGMVGGAIGWQDTGYVNTPVNLDSMSVSLCKANNKAGLRISIVPGIKYVMENNVCDVMRGEEVQVFGAVLDVEQTAGELSNQTLGETMFCLPGTHSKWVEVAKDTQNKTVITSLTTFMTGEMFDLLTKQSILGEGLESLVSTQTDMPSFLKGVGVSQVQSSLLSALFSARTLKLDKQLALQNVPSYISGLLIGAELAGIRSKLNDIKHVYLIGNSSLNTLYCEALKELGFTSSILSSATASTKGMFTLAINAGLVTEKESQLCH